MRAVAEPGIAMKKFPSFRSAPRPAAAEAPPSTLRGTPVAALAAASDGGRRRPQAPTVHSAFDIDRRGDQDVFRYGQAYAGDVPCYEAPAEQAAAAAAPGRVDWRAVGRLAVLRAAPGTAGPMRLGDFVPCSGLEGAAAEPPDPARQRREELNRAVKTAPTDLAAWLGLLRLAAGEPAAQQLAIVERATAHLGAAAELQLAGLRLQADVLPAAEMDRLWERALLLHGGACLWAGHLDRCRGGVGMARYDFALCVDAYAAAVAALPAAELRPVFAQLCGVLRDAGYAERLAALLRAFFDVAFGGADPVGYAACLDARTLPYMQQQQPPPPACAPAAGWLAMEQAACERLWLPRVRDDGTEDAERDVWWADVAPLLAPVAMDLGQFTGILLEALDIEPPEVLAVYGVGRLPEALPLAVRPASAHAVRHGRGRFVAGLLMDAARHGVLDTAAAGLLVHVFRGAAPFAEVEDGLRGAIAAGHSTGPLYFAYARLLRIEGRHGEAERVLRLAYPNAPAVCRRAFAEELLVHALHRADDLLPLCVAGLTGGPLDRAASPVEALQLRRALRTIDSPLAAFLVYACAGIEGLVAAPADAAAVPWVLALVQHALARAPTPALWQAYRDHVYAGLGRDPGCAPLLDAAWHLDAAAGLRSRFRWWAELRLADPETDEAARRAIWHAVLRSCAGDAAKTRAVLARAVADPAASLCSDLWLQLVRAQPDPDRRQAALYRALAACPGAKPIYLEGARTHAAEMVALMEEKGVRVRHLWEEAAL